jgi:multimeric flavodoxin WrbA
MTLVRKGQAPPKLSREAFGARFRERFVDPAFRREDEALARLETIAWTAYNEGRKAPITRKAGAEFADPDYDLSAEWYATRERILAAAATQALPGTRSRVLVIVGAARNDGTCPGEISKSFRLAQIVREEIAGAQFDVDFLDLSLLTSDYGRHIHPCKGCVSTAMPLCHWPCSCYPNHASGQTNDWMAEIYERWTAAHAIIIVTPVYWYQTPSVLKLMIDRLVCADGGNPDPTTTSGKNAERAKAIELAGWDYPKHLADRVYGVVVHGDVAGIESTLHALTDWLDWMGLIAAGELAKLERYIGYYEPYATSHDELDSDVAVQQESRNVARAVIDAVGQLRAGTLRRPASEVTPPRPK